MNSKFIATFAAFLGLTSSINAGAFELICPVEEFPRILTVEIVRDAIECGQDINKIDSFGNTALTRVTRDVNRDVNLELTRMLVNTPGIDLNRQSYYGDTALMYAVRSENKKLVRMLVNAPGIDLNLRDSREKTALHLAVDRKNLEMIRILASAPGIDLNSTVDGGKSSPLEYAAMRGELEIVRILTSNPERISDGHIATTKFLALMHGHQEIADYLDSL